MSRKRGGLSLIEVLLAATLSIIVLGVILWTVFPLMRYTQLGASRAELVEAVAQASRWLVEDLENSSLEGISLPRGAEPGLMSIHRIVDVSATGVSIWDNRLILYNWNSATSTLTRKFWPPPIAALPSRTLVPDSPLQLLPSEMRTVVNQPNATEQILVQGILTQFSVTPASTTSSLPLHLKMVVQTEVAGRGRESYSHQEDIHLRNLGGL